MDKVDLWWGEITEKSKGSPGVQMSPRLDLGADDTGAHLEICVVSYGSVSSDTVHIKTTGYIEKLGGSFPPSSCFSQRLVTSHLLLLLQSSKSRINKW